MGTSTLVASGRRVNLRKLDPSDHGKYDKGDPIVRRKLMKDLESMSALQERLYAEGRQSLLIVLQGMDAGGKDGTIEHVMSGLNPQSCSVSSFKVPTPEELAHDFLWRIHKKVPRKGHIKVFNRSHYEDVLVVRVHNLVSPKIWRKRYRLINEFERLLAEGGTRILKFFLYISKEEQKERLEKRLAEPEKHWKLSASDASERKLWDNYVEAYEEAINRCNTKWAPWHIIPANSKWYRNFVVADVIEKTLRDMDPTWPEPKVDLSTYVID